MHRSSYWGLNWSNATTRSIFLVYYLIIVPVVPSNSTCIHPRHYIQKVVITKHLTLWSWCSCIRSQSVHHVPVRIHNGASYKPRPSPSNDLNTFYAINRPMILQIYSARASLSIVGKWCLFVASLSAGDTGPGQFSVNSSNYGRATRTHHGPFDIVECRMQNQN